MTAPPQPPQRGQSIGTQWVACALVLVPGFALQVWVPAGEQLSWLPMILGSMVGGGIGWLLALPLRRMVPAGEQRSGAVLIVYLAAILWLGPLLLRFVNMGLDAHSATTYTVRVLDRERRSKGPTQVTLQHWADPMTSVTLAGSADPGTNVALVVHPGALGWAWVELPEAVAENERRGLRR